MTLDDMRRALELLEPETPPTMVTSKERVISYLKEIGFVHKQALAQWFAFKAATEDGRGIMLRDWIAHGPNKAR